jgi:quinol monooxygenase YgiN
MLESGKLTADNPANILALVYEDTKDPNVIWVEDIWTSKDAHDVALQNPAIRVYVDHVIPMLEGMPVQTEVVLRGGKGL